MKIFHAPARFEAMEPRKKQLFFTVFATLTLTMSAGELMAGLATGRTNWYIQSFSMLLLGIAFTLAFRKSWKDEQEMEPEEGPGAQPPGDEKINTN